MDIQTCGLILGIISSLLAIFTFITGVSNVQEIKRKLEKFDNKPVDNSPHPREVSKTNSPSTSYPEVREPPRQSPIYSTSPRASRPPTIDKKTAIRNFVLAGIFTVVAILGVLLGPLFLNAYGAHLAQKLSVSNVVDNTTVVTFDLTNNGSPPLCIHGWVSTEDPQYHSAEMVSIRGWWLTSDTDWPTDACIPIGSGETLHFSSSAIPSVGTPTTVLVLKGVSIRTSKNEAVSIYSK